MFLLNYCGKLEVVFFSFYLNCNSLELCLRKSIILHYTYYNVIKHKCRWILLLLSYCDFRFENTYRVVRASREDEFRVGPIAGEDLIFVTDQLEDGSLRTAVIPQLDMVIVGTRHKQVLVGGAPAYRLNPLGVTEIGVLHDGTLCKKNTIMKLHRHRMDAVDLRFDFGSYSLKFLSGEAAMINPFKLE